MTDSSTAEATGGLTVDMAARAFEAMMGADEATPGAETGAEEAQPEAEEEDEPSETEAEESEEQDETEEQQEEQPQTLRVKVDGEEVEVTLDELKNGYSRTQDYTRKTQALAEQAKAVAAREQELAPLRDQYKAVLDAYEQQLATPPHSDEVLEHLRTTDAASYAVAVADNQRFREGLDKLRAEKARVEAEQQQQAANTRAKTFSEAEVALKDAVPEWKDPKAYSDGLKGCFDYAATYGLTPDDILSNADPKQIAITLQVLKDAAAFRAIQSKKPAIQQKVAAVKTAAPGAKQSQPSKVTDLTRSKQRLAQTGRVQDAADVFLKMLPD